MFLLDAYAHFKELLESLLRLDPDALHVHVGIAVFFGVAFLVRGRRPFVTAYWVVLAIAVAAEVFDLVYDFQLGNRLRWLNSVKDIGNAMMWPTAWMLLGPRVAGLVWREGPGRLATADHARAPGSSPRPASTTGVAVPAARETAALPKFEGVGK